MKILVVGHAYLSRINRKKWDVYKDVFLHDEVTVVTPNFWNDALFNVGAANNATAFDKVHYVHLPVASAGNEVLHRYAWRDVWCVMRDVKPDILFVEQGINAFSYFQWILVSLLQFRFIPRLFFTWINWKHKWGLKYWFFWWPIELFNKFFSSAAVVGNPQAEILLREQGFKAPILISPQLGIDEIEELVSQKNERSYIGFVGRLTHEKGVHLLIQAFAQIHSSCENWELLIVGSGPDEKKLHRVVHALGISEKVVFTGAVDHFRALDLIHSCRVLVLPSLDVETWREQFGHVLIEAMAAGVVVVGSDAGAIPWVIGDAGLIFHQNCIEELRDVLFRLLQSASERALYSERGRRRVESLYTHKVIASNIGAFLHAIAQKKYVHT